MSDLKKNDSQKEDYRNYTLSLPQYIFVSAACVTLFLFVSLLFYHNIFAMFFLMPLVFPAFKIFAKIMNDKRRHRMISEFQDAMTAFASAIRVGYSAENGILEAIKTLKTVHGETSVIMKEFVLMHKEVSVGVNVETCLKDLSERSGIKEIENMADVFYAVKREGGSLSNVLSESVRLLEEKSGIEQEINTLMASKKFESRIMYLMPAGILLYMNMTAEEFIEPLYAGLSGKIIMTIILVIYAGAVFLGERLMRFNI